MLLKRRFPALSARVSQRLLAEAGGNPLALLELPVALLQHSVAAAGPLPDALPLTHRLQSMFAARIGALPADCRAALLLAVLDASGDLGVLTADESAALDAADRRRLVGLDHAAARITFRHPLIRSAVVELSTGEERRHAHHVLAARRVADPARHAWHLAEAATGPDEHVAALLQEVAHTNLFRGDAVGAITELLRAAELSPGGTDRSTRLAEAAYLGATVAGDLSTVPALMDAARRADPQYGGSLAGAVAGAYHLLNGDGDVDAAHRLLTEAIDALPDPTDAQNKTLIEALFTLLMVAFFAGRHELWTPFHRYIDQLRPRPPRLLAVLARTFTDPAHLAPLALPDLDAAIRSLRLETSPARIVRTATAASYLDRIGECAEPLRRAVRHGREGGAVTSAIEALFLLGNDAYFTGRWDELTPLVDEGLALCDEHDYRVLRWPGLFLRALVTSARGDQETSKAITDEMARWAAPRRIGAVIAYTAHVKTLAALARGDFDTAYRHATKISPAGRLPAHAPNALWIIMELVEAAARSGRPDHAAAHVAAARDARVAELSPRLALAVAGATAMAAPDDRYRPEFDNALATPLADRWPFDISRIRLAYGERLRRTRSPAAAREHLSAALETFEQLRAQPWITRAHNELRASGVHRAPLHPEELTAQQREIAELAAAGLTNKEIGARLFLSARTVGNHLYQIFPKLGVTSRAALRDALADHPQESSGQS
jgi:DNA-binding CsgD family transcriptional regulator